ncbi:MAG: pyridoxamine 5'-phosphate oxidase family protein [Patescibacteria group bacterium]|nr:pyridoxamine 5'-phosphate oxidase family protein [Patescibacteria group bacterium]
MNDFKKKVDQILQENLYMTISVANRNGQPWIANLYYAYDKNYHFYWYSPKDSLHSQRLRENPSVALAIFDSTLVGEEVDAVYIKANAHEVTSKAELIKGLILYASKMVKTGFVNKVSANRFITQYGDFQGLSKLRMYRAVPEKFWKTAPAEMFNEKFVDSRVEVKMYQ